MANPVIYIKESKVQKSKTVRTFRKVNPQKDESHSDHILRLRKKKANFKVVENKMERHYNYNGNNYVVTTIKAE